jgi:hypothetical protein
MRAWIALLAVTSVIVTSCGGAGKSSTAPSREATTAITSVSSTSTATSTTAAAVGDERIAHQGQLKLADFPTGWEQQDTSSASNPQRVAEAHKP